MSVLLQFMHHFTCNVVACLSSTGFMMARTEQLISVLGTVSASVCCACVWGIGGLLQIRGLSVVSQRATDLWNIGGPKAGLSAAVAAHGACLNVVRTCKVTNCLPLHCCS